MVQAKWGMAALAAIVGAGVIWYAARGSKPAPRTGDPRPGTPVAVVKTAGASQRDTGGLTPVRTDTTVHKWAPAVKPKELSANVKKGLAWLVKTQQANGSWGQGEESAQMGGGMAGIKSSPNVADTCMGALALIRAGNTPQNGEYKDAVQKAVAFVCSEIEQSDEKSMFITNLKGTRTQAKLGQYIDTFMASMLLAEVREQMQDEAATKRAKAAFHKVMDKIEKNQKPDGTWDGQGWAPVLQQSIAAKGINRAAQSGAVVNEEVRAKLEKFSQGNFDMRGGKVALAKPAATPADAAPGEHFETASAFGTDRAAALSGPRAAGRTVGVGGGAAGTAGVELYGWAANVSALRDQENTNALEAPKLKERLASANDEKEKQQIETTLARYATNTTALKAAETSLVQNLQDDRFVNGFGSNGGEEFLSYMNIGESLVVGGGEAWEKWDKQITGNLNRIQNEDGSWTGHHCITGRTFCTSAALLVLTVDRAPVPVAAEIRRR